MEIIYVLLPVSVFLGLIALVAYLWAVKQGQFDDLDTPAMRAIFEDQKSKELQKSVEEKDPELKT